MPQSSFYCFSCQAGRHKYSLAFLSITVLFNRPSTLSQTVKVKLKVAQLCPTLCDPMINTVYGILQARILEWLAFPFSRGSSQTRDRTQVSHIAGRFFTSSATREAFLRQYLKIITNYTLLSHVSLGEGQLTGPFILGFLM